MPQRPDGKSGKRDRVVFNSDGAERIVKVVRIVEAGDRGAAPLRFDRVGGGGGGSSTKVGIFGGTWATGQTHAVTVTTATGTLFTLPGFTVSAFNYIAPIFTPGTAECSITKAGSYYYLTTFNMTRLPDYVESVTQLLGHQDNGTLKWYSVTTCSTATAS